jgi:phage gpG-like protein
MKSGLHTIHDNVAKATAGIEKLATTRVMVGVPAEKGSRSDAEPINNAALAYIHENGAPEAGIPARPFLKPGIDTKQAEITTALEKTGRAALDGNPEAVDRGFNIVGLIGQNAVRAKINTGPFTPLTEATVAARRARGRTGTKPLIDTGQLRNSLTYVIRKP